MLSSKQALTKQPAPPPAPAFEVVGLTDALDEAIGALLKEADLYIVAAKMVVAMGKDAPAEAVKDARRRARLLAAVEALRQHRAGLRPY